MRTEILDAISQLEVNLVNSEKSVFDTFLTEHSKWVVSGVDHKSVPFDFRAEVEWDKDNIAKELSQALELKESESDDYYLSLYDGEAEYCLAGSIYLLAEVALSLVWTYAEFGGEFWIYSLKSGDCFELYHEGVLTHFRTLRDK